MVDQLLQTPSKISVFCLLLNFEAYQKSLMKVLEQVYVDHDVTMGLFDGVVGNITTCDVLCFSDEEVLPEGKKHNHVSSLSNVLVDTCSSLNVMSKTTLSKLAYQGTPMKHSGVVVKAFDGSKRTIIGEVDLPMMIGPQVF